MSPPAKNGALRLLVLLIGLQAGCLAEMDAVEPVGKCGPRDLSPECCLKQLPTQWERCTGSSELAAHSLVARTIAAGVAAAVALQPVIGTAENQGAELSVDLLGKVEEAIARCARKADKEINDYHFDGKSPSREICEQLKVGEQTTWAAYLGLFKHEQAWPCLHEALGKLIPKRYWLHPRFRRNIRTGKWEFLPESEVQEIVASQGWKGLTGTIEPDIIVLDEKGTIVRVYDLKFPCPDTKGASWTRYNKGPWLDQFQGDVYRDALKVPPQLVSPRYGVSQRKAK
jgi:hypothetical protein